MTGNGSSEASRPRPRQLPTRRDREILQMVAKETIMVLPGLLLTRPDAKPDGFLCMGEKVEALEQELCPKLPQATVRVVNGDTIDTALQLGRTDKPVCILNVASAIQPGGGFRNGALGLEEFLCYRTSLAFTLKKRHYPIPAKAAIYSPRVLVVRDSLEKGHNLLDCRNPTQLPVLSVVNVAAIRQPATSRAARGQRSGVLGSDYAELAANQLMEEKMRITLRTVIRNKHRQVVLGAIGWGAFKHPPADVAKMWKQILLEPEFAGGWWEDVIFAVLSIGRNQNYNIFRDILAGLLV